MPVFPALLFVDLNDLTFVNRNDLTVEERKSIVGIGRDKKLVYEMHASSFTRRILIPAFFNFCPDYKSRIFQHCEEPIPHFAVCLSLRDWRAVIGICQLLR